MYGPVFDTYDSLVSTVDTLIAAALYHWLCVPFTPGMRVIVRISSDQRPVEFLAYSKTKGKGIYGELSKNKLPAGYYRNSRQHSIMQSDEIFVAVQYIILARFKLSELGVEAVDTTPL